VVQALTAPALMVLLSAALALVAAVSAVLAWA
jgi:hypothetical protein